jgi:hypothetical protein
MAPKTPQQKKQESYANDRVDNGKYPHADRKNRPQVKASVQRELRRTAKQLLTSQPEDVLQLPEIRTKREWRKTSVPLPHHLADTRQQRIERESHNLFRRGYGVATHARFRHVLCSWMMGRSEDSAALARFYSGILNGFSDELHRDYRKHSSFLYQFFQTEPELKREFEEWILKTISSQATQ